MVRLGTDVHNGTTLFGDRTTQAPALTSSEPANGFRALRLLDSNGDGYISSLDEIFPRLNLWFDRNHNGVGDEGESVALSNLVQSFSLDYKIVGKKDQKCDVMSPKTLSESDEVEFRIIG
ncbi:MAG TPA: hypothetical protein VLB68_02420 [Pyrinomonadaceae bacterium]|nr:hypothetical protein [Pyrinomonadaceae bacterium]